jgi:3-oxoadipate enol-lactonase
MVVGHTLWGQGPEGVIMFNDWLADCSSYEPMLQYLDTEKFTYALMDLRGYGRSRKIPGKHNSMEAAEDAVDLATYLGWDKFHGVGFSMTGMVVERLAIHFLDRIKCLIAIGPVSAAGIKMTPERRAFFLKTLTDDDAVRELATRITSGRLSPQWAEVKLRLARETRDPAAVRDYFDMWTGEDFSKEAMGVNAPILVIAGQYDQESFLEEDLRQNFLKFHPNAELVVIENSGHCPMQETPIRLQTIMEEYMSRYADKR